MEIKELLYGISGSTERGWLGWSSVTLIQTEDRNILFDTGSYNDRPVLLQRLKEYKLSPEDIDAVIISHIHFDHISNIDLFSKAKWYIDVRELEKSESLESPSPEPYRSWLMKQKNLVAIWARDPDTIPSEKERTEKGCRQIKKHKQVKESEWIPEIELVHTPGHSSGSCSAIIRNEGQRIILCGDAIKNREEIKKWNTMDDRRSQWSRSVQFITESADWIIPGHDLPLLPDGTPTKAARKHWIKTNAALEVKNCE